jgi:hypothetical protein
MKIFMDVVCQEMAIPEVTLGSAADSYSGVHVSVRCLCGWTATCHSGSHVAGFLFPRKSQTSVSLHSKNKQKTIHLK